MPPMPTSWDRASPGYVDEWAPRFAPYSGDLVREVGLGARQRALLVGAGPSAVIFAARAVGEGGRVRVVDPRPEMLALVRRHADAAGVSGWLETSKDLGGPWDAVLSGFGSSAIDVTSELHSWADVLDPKGKLGLLLWGPVEPDDPLVRLEKMLADRDPGPTLERAHLGQLLHAAGLVMVRHTIVRHTVSFVHAEELAVTAIKACTWRQAFEAQGAAKCGKALGKLYDLLGGPDAPVSWEPPATLAIAGLPGAEIELPHRPSVKIPIG
jgi:hypothetical protein